MHLGLYIVRIGLICFFVFGCNKRSRIIFEKKVVEGREVIIKKEIDKTGSILTEELLNKDSIRNGYYNEFSSGKLKQSGNYTLGVKEGSWKYWDISDNLVREENWFSGKQFGAQIDYYAKKKSDIYPMIYKYSFYNVEGQNIFECKFGSNGTFLSAKGTPLYCAYNKSTLKVGDSLELIFFIGIPNAFKWSFSIKELGKKDQGVLSEKTFDDNYSGDEILSLSYAKKYFYTKEYLTNGEYIWLLFLQIKSSDGEIIYEGTTEINVSVALR